MRMSRAGFRHERCGAALVVLLLAVLVVAATFFWLGRRDAAVGGRARADPAEPGPYKIKPPNPGGLDVAGESETAFETSAGEDKDSQLDLSKVPETAVAKPLKEQPVQHLPPNETKVPVAAQPAPNPSRRASPAASFQLGAFANQAQAERAWTALSARFPAVAAMNKLIIPFSGGIRLRAGAASPPTPRPRARRSRPPAKTASSRNSDCRPRSTARRARTDR